MHQVAAITAKGNGEIGGHVREGIDLTPKNTILTYKQRMHASNVEQESTPQNHSMMNKTTKFVLSTSVGNNKRLKY